MSKDRLASFLLFLPYDSLISRFRLHVKQYLKIYSRVPKIRKGNACFYGFTNDCSATCVLVKKISNIINIKKKGNFQNS